MTVLDASGHLRLQDFASARVKIITNLQFSQDFNLASVKRDRLFSRTFRPCMGYSKWTIVCSCSFEGRKNTTSGDISGVFLTRTF